MACDRSMKAPLAKREADDLRLLPHVSLLLALIIVISPSLNLASQNSPEIKITIRVKREDQKSVSIRS